jgi:hypothetical protein
METFERSGLKHYDKVHVNKKKNNHAYPSSRNRHTYEGELGRLPLLVPGRAVLGRDTKLRRCVGDIGREPELLRSRNPNTRSLTALPLLCGEA